MKEHLEVEEKHFVPLYSDSTHQLLILTKLSLRINHHQLSKWFTTLTSTTSLIMTRHLRFMDGTTTKT
jgi:hypothetical protein